MTSIIASPDKRHSMLYGPNSLCELLNGSLNCHQIGDLMWLRLWHRDIFHTVYLCRLCLFCCHHHYDCTHHQRPREAEMVNKCATILPFYLT